jgi:type IV secretion/conjugal transfer VirB4 family ATPase
MRRVSRVWKAHEECGALNALIGITAAISDDMFVTKDGGLVQFLTIEGQDVECLEPSQRDQIARRFESAVRVFGPEYRLYHYLLKRDSPPIPHRAYDSPVVRQAVHDRLAYLRAKSGQLYSLDIVLAVVYEGWQPRGGQPAFFAALKNVLSERRTAEALDQTFERASQTLRQKVEGFVAQLDDVCGVRVLDRQAAFRFLRRLLNYNPAKAEAVGLAYESFIDFQACDSSLECHSDHLQLDDSYVQVLTMKSPPSQTFANLFRDLQEVACNFILVNEWKVEPDDRFRRLVQRKRRHHHNAKTSIANYIGGNAGASTAPKDMLVDDGAVAMVSDLGGCLEELVNGRHFGQFSMTAILYGKEAAVVKRAVAEFYKCCGAHDAHLSEERYNLLNAWLAIIPGNHAYNLRRLWLSDANNADLAFLFASRPGQVRNEHLGDEYLAVFESDHGTPYFFNLHYQDVAHSLILGATGSGKSFLLNFLITHLQKYAPVTTLFDLGHSYEDTTRLFGGSCLTLGLEHATATINPFSLPPTPEHLHFLSLFCKVVIESGGYRMTSAEERDLARQIATLYEIHPDQRRLQTLANILQRPLREQLHKWVEGGAYGALFDNVTDTLSFSTFQTFDFEGMDCYPDVLEPLLFYVLHRANAIIYDAATSATFKVFVMDEAWRFFRHPTIKHYLLEALKTWRKRNACMVLATQSADDLLRSDLLAVVLESCVTQLFLANPGMDKHVYRDLFHLNNTETELIARLIPKRQILMKQPNLAKVVHLNVDRKGYWLYTNSPYDNLRKRQVFEEHGLERGLELLARSNPS